MRLRTARKIIKKRQVPFCMLGEYGNAIIHPYTRRQTLIAYRRIVKANKKSCNQELMKQANIYWQSIGGETTL